MARAFAIALAALPKHVIRLGAGKSLLAAALSFPAALLRCGNTLLGPKPNPKKVVLLEPFGLGDIISMEPLARALLERGFEVVLCGNPAWKTLYPERPGFRWIDSRLTWGAHDAKAKYNAAAYRDPRFREFLRTLREAARGGIGVDTRGDIRDVIVLWLSGCSKVCSLARYLGSDTPVPFIAARTLAPSPALRRWEQNMEFLDLIAPGLKPARPAPPAFPHLSGVRRSPDEIGLIAVAPWKGRLWPAERWRELVDYLRRRGLTVRSLCGPGQGDLARQQTGDVETLELRSVTEWAKALSACRLAVSLDTGPAHLADALGTPMVVLFGPGLLPLWAPSGPETIVVSHQDGPEPVVCHQIEANVHLGKIAMDRIAAKEVVDAAARLLGAARARA